MGRPVRRVRRFRRSARQGDGVRVLRVGLQPAQCAVRDGTVIRPAGPVGINSWFFTPATGVPWFDHQPVLMHQPVATMFLLLAILTGLLTGWLHFPHRLRRPHRGQEHPAQPGAGLHRRCSSSRASWWSSRSARWPGLRAALPDVHRGQGQPGLPARRPVGRELRMATMCWSSPMRMPVRCNRFQRPDVPAATVRGRREPGGIHGVRTMTPPHPVVGNPGTPNSDASPDKPNVGNHVPPPAPAACNPSASTVPGVLPFGLDPARTPVMGSYGECRRRQGTSSWYQLPCAQPGPPTGDRRRRRCHLVLRRGGRSSGYGQSLKRCSTASTAPTAATGR